ncbi:hypothetical protein [Virgisporangium aurantiacum]|uniref:Uncharacterized protein n=1 Tax=Virgisporangium aurantiacum TaxID=175570 RepID=A0A8J4E0Y9_9ACTN|nr:hypothetical protein [Virgisporangium aurantiacum]GIJ55482.1 hypothetical protein Vau01_029980 [Virgisporangium aurantiacum]
MDTLLGVLVLLVVALLGYVTGRRFPHPGGWISGRRGRFRAAVVRPPGPWRWRSRLLFVVGALAATAPVWPIVQPGDPVADELLEPAEVAVIVPVVLVFPVAWALLGRSRPFAWRVAVVVAACVAGWSLWTVMSGSYGTPPTIDDGLRWYLVGTGVVVGSATAVESWRRPRELPTTRRVAGALVWTIGVAAAVAVPVVGDERLPPRDAILPLPPATTVVQEEARCALPENFGFGPRTCFRQFTVAATDAADVRELARRLGDHLRRAKGWPATGYDASTAGFPCRRTGWLNPYELCLELRSDESTGTVTLRLAYYNGRDRVIY